MTGDKLLLERLAGGATVGTCGWMVQVDGMTSSLKVRPIVWMV
jgi:hypothetical protein